jgi:hypothetical protein
MANYNFTITDSGGKPVGPALSVPDFTQGFAHIPNTVTFINNTGQTVILTGGSNWGMFFTTNQLIIAAGGNQALTLIIITQLGNNVQLGYTLQYESDADSNSDDNPAFIVCPGQIS